MHGPVEHVVSLLGKGGISLGTPRLPLKVLYHLSGHVFYSRERVGGMREIDPIKIIINSIKSTLVEERHSKIFPMFILCVRMLDG